MAGRALAATALVLVGLSVMTPRAGAGQWVQATCVNPDGTAASSQGWAGFSQGPTLGIGTNSADCSASVPMSATITAGPSVPVGTSEVLEYTPPAGSTLVGGLLYASLSGEGHNPNNGPGTTSAAGFGALYEPAFVFNTGGDQFFACSYWNTPNCAAFTDDNQPVATPPADTAVFHLPPDRSGTLSVAAQCYGFDGSDCNVAGSDNLVASATVHWARLLLSNSATPQATSLGGSALQPGASGTAHLVFTATDSGGPGVYTVTAKVDGHTVWSATPNANGGACVSHGLDPALHVAVFDTQQPCPITVVTDVPIPTRGLSDGRHRLAVSVVDAAGNLSNVVDRRITTFNPQRTPVQRRGVRAQFVISWAWKHRHTTLRSVRVRRLPHGGRVSVRCAGRGCPRLRVRSAPARHVGRLLRALRGRRFTAGDRLTITVTAPGRRRERVRLTFRDNRMPRARLVR